MTVLSGAGSYWIATSLTSSYPQLTGEIKADVAIVGGGIVGVTAARLLKDAGLTVAVLEARKIGQGVTGKSTAKVTSQHGTKYQLLEKKFGEAGARIYAEANEAGIRKIKALAVQHAIDSDLEAKPAYIYTTQREHVAEIEKEADVARRLGLPAALTYDTGLPFPTLAAMRFDDQSQFHPCKYVVGLAATLAGEGCYVFENSRVMDWSPDTVATNEGRVKARTVIMATHMPLGQVGTFYAEAYPHMHPVIVGRVDPGRAPDGMFLSLGQPHHSIRTHRRNGELNLILGGNTFKPGDVEQERSSFEDLQNFAAEQFGVRDIAYRWTNEDYTPMDGAPFIGWSSKRKHSYLVATGFDAWGISTGTAAAMILADIIAGRENQWLQLFDAARVKPLASAARFTKGNLGVAKHLVSGYLSRKLKSFDELAPGEAAIMDIGGETIAAYRDEGKSLHSVSAACTHMGCILGWNEADRTWDCPCHGSRFNLDGEVLHGPAVKSLERKQAHEAKDMPISQSAS